MFTYNLFIYTYLYLFFKWCSCRWIHQPLWILHSSDRTPLTPGLAQLDILYADLTGSEIPFTVWVLGWNMHVGEAWGQKEQLPYESLVEPYQVARDDDIFMYFPTKWGAFLEPQNPPDRGVEGRNVMYQPTCFLIRGNFYVPGAGYLVKRWNPFWDKKWMLN